MKRFPVENVPVLISVVSCSQIRGGGIRKLFTEM